MSEFTPSSIPAARRVAPSPWRNRRVLTGLVVVLLSSVVGASLLAGARATETYWVVVGDVRLGQQVTRDQIRPVEVRVPEEVRKTLIDADSAPRNGTWVHDVPRGSLLSKTAVASLAAPGQHLPLSLTFGSHPVDLQAGDRINVWVGPGPQGDSAEEARRILTEVRVMSVEAHEGGGARTVLVDVGLEGPTPSVVSAVASSHLTAVRVR